MPFAFRSETSVLALLSTVACWNIGEPTQDQARVTWAAFPDTVIVGETFSFEFAGPITPNSCGRLDTATVEVSRETIRVAGLRSVYDTMCGRTRISFYEARPLTLESAGEYRVETAAGKVLGTLTAVDSGTFSPIRTIGEGTLDEAGGCRLFGPGWIGNQRPFALSGLPSALMSASGTDRIVHVSGILHGFTLCGQFGSRPRIEVDTAWATNRTIEDYYP